MILLPAVLELTGFTVILFAGHMPRQMPRITQMERERNYLAVPNILIYDVHRYLAVEAAEAGVSLNRLASSKLAH